MPVLLIAYSYFVSFLLGHFDRNEIMSAGDDSLLLCGFLNDPRTTYSSATTRTLPRCFYNCCCLIILISPTHKSSSTTTNNYKKPYHSASAAKYFIHPSQLEQSSDSLTFCLLGLLATTTKSSLPLHPPPRYSKWRHDPNRFSSI